MNNLTKVGKTTLSCLLWEMLQNPDCSNEDCEALSVLCGCIKMGDKSYSMPPDFDSTDCQTRKIVNLLTKLRESS